MRSCTFDSGHRMEPSAKKMRTEDNLPERGHYRDRNHVEREINCCGEPEDDIIVSPIVF